MSQMQQQFIADLLFSNMNSRETTEDPNDQHVCRICNILGDEKLITSCRCSGSTKFAHTTCLVAWLENSITKRCESCGYHMCIDEKQRESASEVRSLHLFFFVNASCQLGNLSIVVIER